MNNKELKQGSIVNTSTFLWGMLLLLTFNISVCFSKNIELSEHINTKKYFQQIKGDATKLRAFLQSFPKGGDIHHHLDGAIYAESYLSWASKDGLCIKKADFTLYKNLNCHENKTSLLVSELIKDPALVEQAIDAMSVRNYQSENISGHDKFFSTFGKFSEAISGREGDMLAEVTQRAAEQNIDYLEVIVVFGAFDVIQSSEKFDVDNVNAAVNKAVGSLKIKKVMKEVIELTDHAEQKKAQLLACNSPLAKSGCGVEVRYLPSVIRVLPKNLIVPQTALAYQLIAEDERYVGINFVAPEDHPVALADYSWQMKLIKEFSSRYPKIANKVTLHAGELTKELVAADNLKNHITEAVYVAGAKRIGHGVSVLHEDSAETLMNYMAKEQILIEINLTSNDVILGVKNNDHPFNHYLAAGVPITLSTDDEGISRIDLTHEYQRAVQSYQLSYVDVKSFARNSLQYSFLQGKSLFSDYSNLATVTECRNDMITTLSLSESCRKFLQTNDKANLQWNLESRFVDFELSFKE